MSLQPVDLGECFPVLLGPLDQTPTRSQRSEAGCGSSWVVVASGKGVGSYPEELFIFGEHQGPQPFCLQHQQASRQADPIPQPGLEMDRAGPTAIYAPSGIRRLCPDRQASWCAIVWLQLGRPERESEETHPSQQDGG